MTAIASHPPFAVRVERLILHVYDLLSIGSEEYEKAQKEANSANLSRKQRRDAQQKLRRTHRVHDDWSFVQRSATDGIMLTLALQKLPNVRQVLIGEVDQREDRRPVRQIKGGDGPSMSHNFAMVMSSLAHAEVKPHEFCVSQIGSFDNYQAVSIQSLSMPRSVQECLSVVRKLELWLEMGEGSYRSESRLSSHEKCKLLIVYHRS